MSVIKEQMAKYYRQNNYAKKKIKNKYYKRVGIRKPAGLLVNDRNADHGCRNKEIKYKIKLS